MELPNQLPSRLTTLRKACTEAAFDANPESAGAPFDELSGIRRLP